jgi:hypothetical protein
MDLGELSSSPLPPYQLPLFETFIPEESNTTVTSPSGLIEGLRSTLILHHIVVYSEVFKPSTWFVKALVKISSSL